MRIVKPDEFLTYAEGFLFSEWVDGFAEGLYIKGKTVEGASEFHYVSLLGADRQGPSWDAIGYGWLDSPLEIGCPGTYPAGRFSGAFLVYEPPDLEKMAGLMTGLRKL